MPHPRTRQLRVKPEYQHLLDRDPLEGKDFDAIMDIMVAIQTPTFVKPGRKPTAPTRTYRPYKLYELGRS